ncbi:hypothetical protein Misp01_41310 [Microtetraspora sp. NBRC 13810]|uniref:hypothetical protein n=1 Tax=Microtetraspora sp. NBRC 13810 TaxID=3030990 RepID=UPI00255456F2|nr:hypothetical protein [Microtetraspora sp. NBRC 13810]GLW09001.1 hypothetical protein Misp01_41310 [Microtetraspora sp. NBRC 13810]
MSPRARFLVLAVLTTAGLSTASAAHSATDPLVGITHSVDVGGVLDGGVNALFNSSRGLLI